MTDKWFDHWSVLNTLYAIRVWLYLFLSDLLKIVADPEGDGRSPVAVPWNGPVSCISQPVPKTLLAYKLWNPAETEIIVVVSGQSIWNSDQFPPHLYLFVFSVLHVNFYTALNFPFFYHSFQELVTVFNYSSLTLNAASFSCREIRGLLPPWQQKVVSANWWISPSRFIKGVILLTASIHLPGLLFSGLKITHLSFERLLQYSKACKVKHLQTRE